MTAHRRFASRLRQFALALVLLALLAACGGSDTGADTNSSSAENPPPANTVDVKDMRFSPAAITIKAGETVTWRFDDSGRPHNVTGDQDAAAIIKSPIIKKGDYSATFTKPGIYHYTCTLHAQMTGTVTVE
jgi:plastocyanin